MLFTLVQEAVEYEHLDMNECLDLCTSISVFFMYTEDDLRGCFT